MQASYHLNANELNTNILESIKNIFENKNIDIIVTEHTDSKLDERSKELQKRLNDYKENGLKNCSILDKDFWIDTKERLIERH
jgi:flavorubredoxin